MLFRQTTAQSVPEFPSLLLLKARSRRRRALEGLKSAKDAKPRDPAWIAPFRHHTAA